MLWELSGDELGVGLIADARLYLDGVVYVDRIAKRVVAIDRRGSSVRAFGREGPGPGELSDPWAILPLGSSLLVWQNSRGSAFTLFDSLGVVRATAGVEAEGDWRNPMFRSPILYTHGIQHGPEDVTRRLRSIGDSAFLHGLQPDEWQASTEGQESIEPPFVVIRYTARDLSITDTAMVLNGTELVPGRQLPGALRDYWETMFASRPLFATGDGWIATGHGDSASISIVSLDSTIPAGRIVWDSHRPPIEDKDKMAAVDFTLEAGLRNSPAFAEEWSASPRRVRKAAINEQKTRWLKFPDRAPEITSMLGGGMCIFLSGFNAHDNVDGAARNYTVVHVAQGVLGVLSIGRQGDYLRDIQPNGIVLTRRDEYGEWFLALYGNPFADQCRS